MNELSIRDFKILAELIHHQSLRSVSRTLNIDPQHLSKLLKNIEEKIGKTLLLRSPKGISPTPEALEYAEMAKNILLILNEFEDASKSKKQKKFIKHTTLTFASRVFINTYCSPLIATLCEEQFPQFHLRFVDASPKKKEEWARQGLLDLVLSVGPLDLGKSWVGHVSGKIDWNFYARAGHPLGHQTTSQKLCDYPFIGFAYVDDNRIIELTKLSPAKLKSESLSFMTETTLTSMNIAAATDHITYIPDIITRDMVKAGKLQKIVVREMLPLTQELYLYAHLDRVKDSFYHRLLERLREELESI